MNLIITKWLLVYVLENKHYFYVIHFLLLTVYDCKDPETFIRIMKKSLRVQIKSHIIKYRCPWVPKEAFEVQFDILRQNLTSDVIDASTQSGCVVLYLLLRWWFRQWISWRPDPWEVCSEDRCRSRRKWHNAWLQCCPFRAVWQTTKKSQLKVTKWVCSPRHWNHSDGSCSAKKSKVIT